MGSNFFATTIGEQVTLQRGFDITKREQQEGNVPVVSSGGISSYHNVSKVAAPGVVLGRKGTLGTVYFMDEDFWPHDTSLWVKDFKGNNPHYVYYFFKSMSAELKKMDVGAANPALNRNHVHSLEVEWPSRELQDKIVSIGAALDQKITINNKINQSLEQMTQTLFKSWFVDFSPVIDNALDAGNAIPEEFSARAGIRKSVRESEGFKPLAKEIRLLFPSEFEESELGWMPKGWLTSTTGEELTVKGGSTPSTKNPDFWSNGDINWSSPKDLSDNDSKIMLETSRKITKAGLEKITSGLLPSETVLMSSRAPVGYLALTRIPVAINQGYIAIPKSKQLSQEYILYWLDFNMDTIKGLSGGTTFAEISKKTFRSIDMLVPPLSVVEAFSNSAGAYLNKISSNVEESQLLTKVRDSLLAELLSGELEVVHSGN